MFHPGHARRTSRRAQGVLSYLAGFRPPAGTAFPFFLWLALPSSSERRPVRLLPFGSATFPSSLLRSSDDLLLRSFFVGPVLRPGLNSIHFTQSDDTFRRSSLSANPAIRSTRRFFRLQRHVVVFSFFPSDSGTVCSLSATPAIRSARRFFRLQRHVVVFFVFSF